MKIGQVASAAGVSIDTIRFYERRGVLPPAPRTAAGYRIFTEATVTGSGSPAGCRALGLTLDEITGALHAQHEGQATCESERWRLRAALDRIESRIADLAPAAGPGPRHARRLRGRFLRRAVWPGWRMTSGTDRRTVTGLVRGAYSEEPAPRRAGSARRPPRPRPDPGRATAG